MKELDLNKSVYDLTEEYPELIEVLKDLGFLGLANPALRKSVGKLTKIPQGAKNHGIDLKVVIESLKAKGFTVKE